MAFRDWKIFGGKKGASPGDADERPYSAMPDDELRQKAETLDWKPTRNDKPGIAFDACTPDEQAFLGELEIRKMVEFVMASSSLGGAGAYYAKDPSLVAAIQSKPDYAQAKNEFDEAANAKLMAKIASAAEIPGWESDYKGGYSIVTKDRRTDKDKDKDKVTPEALGMLQSLGREQVVKLEIDTKSVTYSTQEPRLVSAIDAVQTRGQNSHVKDEPDTPGEHKR